jgi:hypothetical protein
METGNEDGRTLGGKEGSEGEVSGVCRGRHWQRMTLSRDPLGRELARCSRPGERSIAVERLASFSELLWSIIYYLWHQYSRMTGERKAWHIGSD